jgi:hypothetical protein
VSLALSASVIPDFDVVEAQALSVNSTAHELIRNLDPSLPLSRALVCRAPEYLAPEIDHFKGLGRKSLRRRLPAPRSRKERPMDSLST